MIKQKKPQAVILINLQNAQNLNAASQKIIETPTHFLNATKNVFYVILSWFSRRINTDQLLLLSKNLS